MVADLQVRLQSALGAAYRIEHELGGGGMSRVFLARERELDRQVVVKVLPPEMAAGVNAERFRREIQLAASLQHPHIVPLLAAGHADDLVYYTMPLIEGESLRAKLAREGELPINETVRILRDVVDALAYAHAHSVAHRDIKPDNVLISGPHAVVTDFGVAKALSESTGKSSLTSAGVALGTPAYMAPEQAAADPHTDHRCDIYAVGALGYELLTGRPPFVGTSPQQVLAAVATQTPEPLARYRPTVPPAIADLVVRCLEKHPADRWQTADELLRHLEGLATPSGGTTPVPAVAPTRRTTHVGLLGVAAAGLVVAVGSFLLLRAHRPGHVGPGADRKMMAVLPFQNLGSADDDYFADGITEEITARLASLSGLGVISRTSAIQYKNTKETLRQIGQELGVQYVLEGTIRWERAPGNASRVRVTPQLIRVADDTHLWAAVFDTVLADIFAVQAGIAERVSDALDIALANPERQALAARPTDNLEAYTYYLRGLDYMGRPAEQNYRLARTMFERAVAADPKYALGYANLARALDYLYWYYDRTDERRMSVKRAVDRALELEPNLAEGHLALGYYYYHGYLDYDRALTEFATARRRQPNSSEVWAAEAFVRRRQGRWEDAAAGLQRAVELDPRSNNLAEELGKTYVAMRRFAEAERYYNRAQSLAPSWATIYAYKAWLYFAWSGDVARVRRVLDEASTRVGSTDLLREVVAFAPLVRALDDVYGDKVMQLPLTAVGADTASYYGAKAAISNRRGQGPKAGCYYDSLRVFEERATRQHPNDDVAHHWLAYAYAGLGRKDAAVREGLEATALLPMSRDAYWGAIRLQQLAVVYVMVGDYDAALEKVEFLLSVPAGLTVPMLKQDPLWAPLRGNPRFEKLLRRS